MEVLSVNIARPRQIEWNGKIEYTGIFKSPVEFPIHLGKTAVSADTIVDRKVHGGTHKACYVFSAQHYPYWKKKYPELPWTWGMFGENLTLRGMDESVVRIGNVYRIGQALVQVSMPREPCYKLGVRFGTQSILKEFIAYGNPGAYVRVLEEGLVKPGDRADIREESDNALTVRDCFLLYYAKEKPADILGLAIENQALPKYKRDKLAGYKYGKGP
jgi:MOSC domain-containing protein YiiM